MPNFNVVFKIPALFCYDVPMKSIKFSEIVVVLLTRGVAHKNCVTQLDFTSIYVQFISMICLQNIETLRKIRENVNGGPSVESFHQKF